MKFLYTHTLFALIAAIAPLPLSGCAATSRQTHSALPIEVLDSTGGEIASTRAFETATTLYVAGTMRKHLGSHLGASAHVDVQLLDRAGNVISEVADDIDTKHPTLSQGRSGRYSYVASFPLVTAGKAAKIRVTYHRTAH